MAGKIFESREELKTREGLDFIKKIKLENPDLLNKFLNIVTNKGLNVAIEKYKEFDPEIIARKKSDIVNRQREYDKRIKTEREKENLIKIKKEYFNIVGNVYQNVYRKEFVNNIVLRGIQKYLRKFKNQGIPLNMKIGFLNKFGQVNKMSKYHKYWFNLYYNRRSIAKNTPNANKVPLTDIRIPLLYIHIYNDEYKYNKKMQNKFKKEYYDYFYDMFDTQLSIVAVLYSRITINVETNEYKIKEAYFDIDEKRIEIGFGDATPLRQKFYSEMTNYISKQRYSIEEYINIIFNITKGLFKTKLYIDSLSGSLN